MDFKKVNYYIYNFNWWNVRIFAILLIPLLFLGIELFFFLQALLCEHVLMGIRNTIKDYIHNTFLQALYKLLFYIVLLQYLRTNIELWF